MLILMLGVLVPTASRAQNVNQVAKAGSYTVNLKVLPAESFAGPGAEMVRDSGAEAAQVHGPEHPNHHLVVFIKKDGKPVENAQVAIAYKKGGAAHWQNLPVARMHVSGKGPETTHYGNNLKLEPGKYRVRVTINSEAHTTFHFTLG